MEGLSFRALRADEVECRVSTISEKGLSLLLYKDARCDMNILDETVGPMNWQRTHSRDNANCVISIWDDEKERWVGKEDTGTESYTEKEKGLASDSFKRAGFNWGIGRELYTAPFIYVPAVGEDGKPNYNAVQKNGKPTTYDRFTCTYMRVENGKIIALNIENAKLRRSVYVFGDIFADMRSASPILCPICGKEVKDVKKDGRTVTAKEVYTSCGGMCIACYKSLKAKEGHGAN